MRNLLRAYVCVFACGCGSAGERSDAAAEAQDATVADAAPNESSEADTSTGDASTGTGAPDGGVDPADADAVTPMADAGDAPEPIVTPFDTWTWLPIPGSVCGDGSATGIGINRSQTSNDLTIMLAGGGACWDGDTCYTRSTAVHVAAPYDNTLFQSEFVATANKTRDPNNPLTMATQVFVPYCTGDLHGGDAVRDYTVAGATRTMHHAGSRNIAAILQRLTAGLPTPQTVWLFGSSAGGYGSALNLRPVEEAYPSASVHMLADSAPTITPSNGLWDTWRTAWNLQFPSECSGCSSRFGALIDVLAQDSRHGRIGLMANDQDATIAAYFGMTGAVEQTAVRALLSASYQYDDTRYFLAHGTDHVLIIRPATVSPMDGVVLNNWLIGYILGGPTWVNAD